MKIQKINNKLIVELEFFDWNNGSGQRINQAIKSLPKEDRIFNWETKQWEIRDTRNYGFMLEDLKYGGGLNNLVSYSKKELEMIDQEFLTQFNGEEEWTNII